ncbi:hypothetical protein KRR38_22150 [Novosphingobium sp. G106]|uniref:hypothetical protein n=1 Tax=Novosphingobium sp. G106 TaxID=2849500 RepID=UPI001C2D9864|nr:hypothetical protein [Novosphingobium sp. G106]MBV1690310.1 hypothetical protein [Novosphingobium sp. G106]
MTIRTSHSSSTTRMTAVASLAGAVDVSALFMAIYGTLKLFQPRPGVKVPEVQIPADKSPFSNKYSRHDHPSPDDKFDGLYSKLWILASSPIFEILAIDRLNNATAFIMRVILFPPAPNRHCGKSLASFGDANLKAPLCATRPRPRPLL